MKKQEKYKYCYYQVFYRKKNNKIWNTCKIQSSCMSLYKINPEGYKLNEYLPETLLELAADFISWYEIYKKIRYHTRGTILELTIDKINITTLEVVSYVGRPRCEEPNKYLISNRMDYGINAKNNETKDSI